MSATMPTIEDARSARHRHDTSSSSDAGTEQKFQPATLSAISAGLITLLVLAVSTDRIGFGAGSLNLRTELMAGGVATLILLLRSWRTFLSGWGIIDACLGGWFLANVVSSLLFSPNLKESLKYVAILAGLMTIYIACRKLIATEAALTWATTLLIVLGTASALLGLVCALLFNVVGPNFGILLERFYRDGVFVVTPKVQGLLWEPNIYGSFSLAVAVLAGALAFRKQPDKRDNSGVVAAAVPGMARFAPHILHSPIVLSTAITAGTAGVMLSMTRTVWILGPALILLLAATAWKIKLASPGTIAVRLLLPAILGGVIGLGVGSSLPALQWKMDSPWDMTPAQVDDMVRQRLSIEATFAQGGITSSPTSPAESSATPLSAGESSAPADRIGELLGSGAAPSVASRWRIYSQAFDGWLQLPLLGWGAGTFPYVYPPPPEGGYWIANIELHALFDTGIVGLALLAAAALLAGWRAVQTLRLPPSRWSALNYLTFGILFASIGLLAAFQITDGTWLGFTWVVLAMLVASGQKSTADQTPAPLT